MNHFTIPLKSHNGIPANEINRLADKFLMNFKVSGKNLSTKNWGILAEILDFVVEAEQTIADQNERIEKLEVMTTTDPLTGLLNRRGIMQELSHAIAAAERHGESAIFVYIDLDGFKQINDRFGHAAGDAQLTFVADTLLSAIRQTDYAARLGGDEFALLLRHSDLQGGKQRTHFIQQQLNFTKFTYKNHLLPVRASFGIAEISPGINLDDIIKIADSKMYHNKSIRSRR
ncbi:MAG: GGDEF domain-containing protein [Emcibacter sp.]|nr:GGDEF domain-containing protein [Emcibacter sp.]MBL4893451.1 GGDEF domain-containing protein [Emcibacter sp.]